MANCKNCGHPEDEHASDISFPDIQRCFHGAATGEGCAEKYDQRCKNFVPKEG